MRWLLFYFLISVFIGSAYAASEAPPLREGPPPAALSKSAKADDGVLVNSIKIENANAVPAAQLDAVVQSFVGTPVNKADLQEIANRLTKAYLDRGYFLSKAVIKPQALTAGVLTVHIVEGTLASVRVNGNANHPLSAYFKSVIEERPVTRKTFERAITLVETLPGYRVTRRDLEKVVLKDGAFVLHLTVKHKLARVQIDLTNKGVREGLSWRSLVGGQLRSIAKTGDQLRLGALKKPGGLSELTYAFGRYDAPIGTRGLVAFIEGVYSDTNPRSALVGRDLNGTLRSVGAGFTYPLIQKRRSQLLLSTRFDWLNSYEYENGAALYTDRMRIARASAQYTRSLGRNGRGSLYVQASQGVDLFNASTQEGFLTSRPDADGQFFKVDGRAFAQKFITDRISVTGSIVGQYASDSLLFLEEFTFGGGLYGRGYDFAEIIGDHGLAGFAEAGYHGRKVGPVDRWEVYGFADIGAVWNEGDGLSIDGDPLYSAGAGVRVTVLDHVFLNYEAAYPIADAPFTEKDGDVRHRLQVTVSYE